MSYNPSRIQRSYDKLHSAWGYLNWKLPWDDEGVQEAMNLLQAKKCDVIVEAWATRREEKLNIDVAHDRSRAKWNANGI